MLISNIEVTNQEHNLLKRIGQFPNMCCEIQKEHPIFDQMVQKGILRRCKVRVFCGGAEPGVAVTEFGKEVLRVEP